MSLKITNGTRSTTVFVTSKEFVPDVYFPIKDSIRYDVDIYAVEEVAAMISKHHLTSNFVIDSRHEFLILILDRMFPSYITVFDIYSTKMMSVNHFLASSSMFNISEMHLYTNDKRKLVDMYLVLKFITVSIPWRINTAMNVLNQSTLVDLLLNYLGFQDIEPIDMTDKAEMLVKIIKNGFKNEDESVVLFGNRNELMNALILLRDNERWLVTY